MAKDPAFLFYPNDWIGGTMGMSFEEKGAYMELLMMQFNRGHMTYDMMAHTAGRVLDKVLDKFIKDAEGLYYNVRLEEEKLKRKRFVDSRLNNKIGSNQHSKKEGHTGGHTTSDMEDVNNSMGTTKNLNNDSNNINNATAHTGGHMTYDAGTKILKHKDEPEKWRIDVKKFISDAKFKHDFCAAKNIQLLDLEKRMSDFVIDLNLKMDYKDVPGLKRHFINHYRKHVENGGVPVNSIGSKGFIETSKQIDYENLKGAW